ncbi:hypothetical protein SODALDRAFT_364281 [Sodiomyces alkalinus F11]|uniref:Uncharacterized protein n=1 Tax=Sodiomyces alkalinus (strain CBS 110278 / VKM F-3762 / F11) TaxID=1314773 RepID=A0A3N2PK17_SODAK|nr:hypothetical protein SODALDRAFT_364281 [Sodiomyces alkalinus F11]ROT34770.1 hypothetical protein SODALDRAFT_364281 [Sodiomyces alkalinus F11]
MTESVGRVHFNLSIGDTGEQPRSVILEQDQPWREMWIEDGELSDDPCHKDEKGHLEFHMRNVYDDGSLSARHQCIHIYFDLPYLTAVEFTAMVMVSESMEYVVLFAGAPTVPGGVRSDPGLLWMNVQVDDSSTQTNEAPTKRDNRGFDTGIEGFNYLFHRYSVRTLLEGTRAHLPSELRLGGWGMACLVDTAVMTKSALSILALTSLTGQPSPLPGWSVFSCVEVKTPVHHYLAGLLSFSHSHFHRTLLLYASFVIVVPAVPAKGAAKDAAIVPVAHSHVDSRLAISPPLFIELSCRHNVRFHRLNQSDSSKSAWKVALPCKATTQPGLASPSSLANPGISATTKNNFSTLPDQIGSEHIQQSHTHFPPVTSTITPQHSPALPATSWQLHGNTRDWTEQSRFPFHTSLSPFPFSPFALRHPDPEESDRPTSPQAPRRPAPQPKLRPSHVNVFIFASDLASQPKNEERGTRTLRGEDTKKKSHTPLRLTFSIKSFRSIPILQISRPQLAISVAKLVRIQVFAVGRLLITTSHHTT